MQERTIMMYNSPMRFKLKLMSGRNTGLVNGRPSLKQNTTPKFFAANVIIEKAVTKTICHVALLAPRVLKASKNPQQQR